MNHPPNAHFQVVYDESHIKKLCTHYYLFMMKMMYPVILSRSEAQRSRGEESRLRREKPIAQHKGRFFAPYGRSE